MLKSYEKQPPQLPSEPKVTSSNSLFFVGPTAQKPNMFHLLSCDKEKQQILTSEKLEPENDWNDSSVIKIVAYSFSFHQSID